MGSIDGGAPADDQGGAGAAAADRLCLDALAGSATALAMTVARRDFTPGVVVIDAALPPGTLGLAWGTGHALAAAHGEVMGRAGVLLNVADCLLLDGPAGVEVTALHELAHTLMAREDIPEALASTAGTLRIAETTGTLSAAAAHHPGWAAAFAVFVTRATRFRPQRAAALVEVLDRQLRKHGYPGADAVLEALGPVDDDAPLRPILGWGGCRTDQLFLGLPPDHERAAAIAAIGEYRDRVA